MGKLIRKILENVAGAVGAIAFSDWNGQTVIKAKSEGSTSQYIGSVAAFTQSHFFIKHLSQDAVRGDCNPLISLSPISPYLLFLFFFSYSSKADPSDG